MSDTKPRQIDELAKRTFTLREPHGPIVAGEKVKVRCIVHLRGGGSVVTVRAKGGRYGFFVPPEFLVPPVVIEPTPRCNRRDA